MASEKDQRPSWAKAIGSFLLPLVLFLSFRWIGFEPFVIPSGSMIPSLLQYDNILVAKWSYGLRLPFTESWLAWWRTPQRGEVVVFRYPPAQDVFYVKRIIAIGGDVIELRQGDIYLNHERLRYEEIEAYPDAQSGYAYFMQSLDGHEFVFQRDQDFNQNTEFGPFEVPEGHFFVIGDNRDHSSDSRSWGSVPYEKIIGRPLWIWLSCNQTLPQSAVICDPGTIRQERLGKAVQ